MLAAMPDPAVEETGDAEETTTPSRILGEQAALVLGLAALLIVALLCLGTLVHIVGQRY
jgi:hypothetical protein